MFHLSLSSFQGTSLSRCTGFRNNLQQIGNKQKFLKDIQFLRIALSKLTTSCDILPIYPIIILIGYSLRKEVIQPHLPIRLPCYDFTPIIYPTFDGWLLAVTPPASGVVNSRGVTGGVYKTRERIHRGMLIRDY